MSRIGIAGAGLAAVLLVVAGWVATPADEPDGPFGPVRAFTIDEGDIWAGPLRRRVRFWGTPTRRPAWDFRVRFHLADVPDGMSIKIIGLSDLTPRSNRVRLYGSEQTLSITHEDSDRFVGTVTTRDGVRGLQISAYAYRDGYGGISSSREVSIPDSLGPLTVPLGFLPDSTWGTLTLRRGPRTAEYALQVDGWPGDSTATASIPLVHRPSRLQERWSGFAHAGAGSSQPRAPATLRFEIAKR
ncbi:MAG: hypothetical protein JJ896_08600 [Rhodothermales bacterium]|nr:hypothetical protein [Rhodothermales bacterium]MBO6779697.1 hypothetical protein [Rhodothermales bacterium]